MNLDGLIGSVHLFSEGLDGKAAYSGELPWSIHFGDKRDDVRRKCGRLPDKSGEEGAQWQGNVLPAWDLYECDGKQVHIQYSRVDAGAELITISLMPEEWFPTLEQCIKGGDA